MANRLAQSSSPYLRQHAENPVDWYPWGEEAFEASRAAEKPIFLSVGYSSCHWCHVMAHESFEDRAVADVLNRDFVCIKVDREELPDVDEAFMTFIQLTSGRGGWPMSVFLTPECLPFFGGTYWPKLDRGANPGFLSICRQLADVWKSHPSEIRTNAEEMAATLRTTIVAEPPEAEILDRESLILSTLHSLAASYDPANGGFGGAPKFPPHSALEFLCGLLDQPHNDPEVAATALELLFGTLEKMALGGIRDHVGGGFHRYSTDAYWHLPHFEKMLYDNALLLANYCRGIEHAKKYRPELVTLFERTRNETIEWLKREMRLPSGLFASALDADSEGEEGAFYVWSADEMLKLGVSPGFLAAYGVERDGNYFDEATSLRAKTNVLHALEDPGESFELDIALLLAARAERSAPQQDDKALVSWNGLLIRALVMSNEMEAARTAADVILDAERTHGRLPHLLSDRGPQGHAYLDDYAAFALALFALGEREASYCEAAIRLTEEMVRRFYDEAGGGFFSLPSDGKPLFGRTKPVFDQPIPSANALAIQCLIHAGDTERAQRSLAVLQGWIERAPQATEGLLTAVLNAGFAGRETVHLELSPPVWQHTHDGSVKGQLILRIPEGYSVTGPDPAARWKSSLEVSGPEGNVRVTYPTADEFGDYSGDVTLEVEADTVGEALTLSVRYQVCTQSECLPPKTRRLSVPISASAPA